VPADIYLCKPPLFLLQSHTFAPHPPSSPYVLQLPVEMHQEIRPAPPPRRCEPPPATSLTDSADGGGGSQSYILRSHRLALRHFTLADAPFILTLLNDPSWLRYIGDRNVHSLQDAERYLRDGPFAMQATHGHSLWAVTLADTDAAIGMCGLLKRDSLASADVGYAFLPEWRGQGFAREAVASTLRYGRDVLGMKKIVAVSSIDNERSIRSLLAADVQRALSALVNQCRRLLEGVGMREQGRVRLSEGAEECRLFVWGDEE
jgi:[ribosomal protein S5]-alanine N-acetyltransferase